VTDPFRTQGDNMREAAEIIYLDLFGNGSNE
jgi:hypothetical protein